MKRLAIIGASYLQEPLIRKAKSRNIETHVFAWKVDDVGEKLADFFYPISIVEKELILEKCKEIEIDGICSIASDLAIITVNYVAERMGLIGNSMRCTEMSTNKYKMRKRFACCGDPSPKSIMITSVDELKGVEFSYPVIVKPIDRSGSRGINKLDSPKELDYAILHAIEQGFEKKALVEEFVEGQEYSVEFLSWEGCHYFLAMTEKYTTGAPAFIERAHLEPAQLDKEIQDNVIQVVAHALDSLEIQYGASHSEVKISENGDIKIIEIGGRMGGDCIGSSLVELSTGIDFVGAVIDVALGIKPTLVKTIERAAAVRFVFDSKDLIVLDQIKKDRPELLVSEDTREISGMEVTDSSTRFGYFLLMSNDLNEIRRYLS